MKISLTKPTDQWTIWMQVERNGVCTRIRLSVAFEPYERLYIWLGQIRDCQLPALMLIPQESCNKVELIAERASDDSIAFRIDLWEYGENTATHFATALKPDELIKAFYDGITEFINDENHPLNWSFIENLSNLNWGILLKSPATHARNWQKRLLMSKLRTRDGKIDRSEDSEERALWQQLTPEQQWSIVLRELIEKIEAAATGNGMPSIAALASLYRNLPVDIALGEIDRDWYEGRRFMLNREHESDKKLFSQQEKEEDRILAATRLKMLRVGQIVDGTVKAIKPYGLIVNIGGITALLRISAISQNPVDKLHTVFKHGDWIRAIIVSIDLEKGRVSLSTSELEVEPGDMLKHPWKVYETATEKRS